MGIAQLLISIKQIYYCKDATIIPQPLENKVQIADRDLSIVWWVFEYLRVSECRYMLVQLTVQYYSPPPTTTHHPWVVQ